MTRYRREKDIVPRVRHNFRTKRQYYTFSGSRRSSNDNGKTWSIPTQYLLNWQHDDTRSGVSLPKWKELVKVGKSATTVMSATKYKGKTYKSGITDVHYYFYDSTKIHRIERFVGTHQSVNPFTVPPTHLSGVDVRIADRMALSRLYSRIREVQTQISGPTVLGELRETIGMIRRPGKKMFKEFGKYLNTLKDIRRAAYNNVRLWRNRAKAVKHMLNSIANAWLEFSFGIKPVLQDTEDIAVAIARFSNNIRAASARGFGTHTVTQPYSYYDAPFGNYVGYTFKGWLRTELMVIYKCGISADFGLPDEPLARLQSLFGFKAQEFVPTIWELIPFSFLVDYFVNVGDVLSATLTDTSMVTWVQRTQRSETSGERECILTPTLPQYVMRIVGPGTLGKFEGLYTSVQRAPNASVPPLELTFSLPGRTNQFRNMAALAAVGIRDLERDFQRLVHPKRR